MTNLFYRSNTFTLFPVGKTIVVTSSVLHSVQDLAEGFSGKLTALKHEQRYVKKYALALLKFVFNVMNFNLETLPNQFEIYSLYS